ncbi:MAG: DOPA 4,5-dioxygenase family protein, partial [Pseudomonadota bacterium]
MTDTATKDTATKDTATRDTSTISGWHAHVYFGPEQVDRAKAVCEAVRDSFGVQMGRMHVEPVGPHPTGSCQLTVPPEKLADVTAWLALNRDGLTVFTHAETGDVMADHTRHVVWLGESQSL